MILWQPPLEIHHNGPLIGYVIKYTRGDIVKEIFTSGTSFTISQLTAYVNYSVSVAAMNVNGTGPFSNPVMQLSGENSKLIKQVTIIWCIMYSLLTLLNNILCGDDYNISLI